MLSTLEVRGACCCMQLRLPEQPYYSFGWPMRKPVQLLPAPAPGLPVRHAARPAHACLGVICAACVRQHSHKLVYCQAETQPPSPKPGEPTARQLAHRLTESCLPPAPPPPPGV